MNGLWKINFVGRNVIKEVADAHTVMDIVAMVKRDLILVGMETVPLRQ